MSLRSLSYEEVGGYSPTPSFKKKAFLKVLEKQSIKNVPLAKTLYYGYKGFLIFLLGLSIVFKIDLLIIIPLVVISPVFISIIDREIYNLSIRKLAYETDNAPFRKWSLPESNGWYDDPYSYGVIGQKRKWEEGKWTKDTRNSVT